MVDQINAPTGFRLSPPVNLAERLSQIHLAVQRNFPTNPFDVEVTVSVGSMPLTLENSNYIIEARRLFVSYRAEGCRLQPESVLLEQKIRDGGEERRGTARRPFVRARRSRFKVDAKVSLPLIHAKGSYENAGEVEATDDSVSQQMPPLIAMATYAAGGWDLFSVDEDGKPSCIRPLRGIMLSGAFGERVRIGAFEFDPGKETSTIHFEIRLPRGSLNLMHAERQLLSPRRRKKEQAESALEGKMKDNFEALKSRIAGLCMERAAKLANSRGRDEDTGELVLSFGSIEAILR